MEDYEFIPQIQIHELHELTIVAFPDPVRASEDGDSSKLPLVPDVVQTEENSDPVNRVFQQALANDTVWHDLILGQTSNLLFSPLIIIISIAILFIMTSRFCNFKSREALSLIKVVSAICLYSSDIGSDILLGIKYVITENYFWGCLTIGIVLFAGALSAWTSFHSKILSEEERKSIVIIILHVFLLGPAYQMWKHRDSKNNILLLKEVMKIRFIEAALQAAPQLFLQFHILNVCRRAQNYTAEENIFCDSIREGNIEDIIIPVITMYLSLISFSWAITSQKKILQYEDTLNAFRIGYVFVMFVLQVFTRAYILLFILNEVDEIWGLYGILVGFGIPILTHVFTICFLERNNSRRKMFFSISKIFFFDLDDESRPLGTVNAIIHHVQYIGFLSGGYCIFKYARHITPTFHSLPFILIFIGLILNFLWFYLISPRSGDNRKQAAYSKGNPDTSSSEIIKT